MDDPVHIANAFPDKRLLDYLRSGEKTQGLREILDAFSKFSLSACLDHTTLRALFDGLRKCASSNSRWISSVIPHLANLYDNLLLRDLSQSEISVSICELLFFIEDLVDHGDCKIMAGQHFLGRLLILAGSKLTGIRLQRAAVETLSSLISMCPTNQRIVSEEFSFQWQKIVKQVLPQCGDFFVQASIVEILYRLSKKHVHLLDALEDRKLKGMIISLHKVKKPDLHAQTRAFLDHLNGSLGLSRSVLSCLGEDIMCSGISTPLKCERWVHFAADHISLYAALNSESETSLLDVFYTKIKHFQMCSNNCIEMVVQGLLYPEMQEPINQVTTTKFLIVLKPEDLAIVKDYVLPRINHLRKQGSKNEPNNANTSITPHTSGSACNSFRKASIGFGIPLPKKVGFPILSSISNVMPEDDFFKERHENESVSKHISEPSRKSNEKASNEEIQEENMNLNVQASKETILQYNKNLTANGITADSRDMISKEGNISKTVAKATESRMSISETQCPQRTLIGDKQQEMVPNLKPSSALLDTSMYVEPKPNRSSTSVCNTRVEDSIKNALGSSPKSMKQERKHPGHLKPKRNSHLLLDEAPKYSSPTKREPVFKPDAVRKANPGSAALQKSIIESNVKVKDASVVVEKKITDSNQADQWRAKILHILEDTSLNVPSREKNDNFTSDPIESDSGHTSAVPGKSNPNGKRVTKTTYKHDKKQSLNSQKRQASTKNPKTETEKDDRVICTENAPEKDKDVFCFENDQQCKRSLCKPSADGNQENHEFFNAIDADYLRTPFKPTVDNMEVPHLPKRSSCSTQGRKEEHSTQTGPAKKLRLSSKNIDSESMINPSPPSEKSLGFGDSITLPKSDGFLTINGCASTPRSDALFSFGCTSPALEKEDKIHPFSTFSKQNQTEKACDLKEKDQRCFQSSPLPTDTTYRSDGQYQKTQRRTKSRNEQMNFFLQEHLQITKVDNDDDDTNGEMQLFANALQKIMNKVKVIKDRKSTEILASTKEKIMNRCKEAQEHIESDLNEYKKLSMERFGQLQLQLQDEYEAFKSSQKKWKDEMHTHLKHFKDISAQVETSESYLKSISDKQKIAHKKLYSKVNEFAEQYIKEAEQQLRTLQKAAVESRNDLKKTILDIL